ncbi:MAG: tetratricopeptide repeat protein [Planctomycetota bacterium]
MIRPRLRALAAAFALLTAPAGAAGADAEIRPFDEVYLKTSPDRPIVGLIEGESDPTLSAEIVIRTMSGVTSKIRSDQILRVVPRQTAEDVYAKKAKEVRSIRDPSARAAAELSLALWCNTPLGVLSGRAPRPQSALEHFFVSLELSPGTEAAYPHAIALLSELGPLDDAGPERISREFQLAYLAREGGVSVPELSYRLGVLLCRKLQLPDRGAQLLEEYLARGDGNLGQERRAREILRDIFIAQNDLPAAIAMYAAAIVEPPSAPRNFEPFYELGRLYARVGTEEALRSAREFYARAQELQPDFPDVARDLAALDYRAGDAASAEKALAALLKADPSDAAAALDLALVLRKLGKRAEAEKVVRGLDGSLSGEDEAQRSLVEGALLEDGGDVAQAVSRYRRASELAPERAEPALVLAGALLRAGQPAEARKLAAALLGKHGSSPKTFAAASRVSGEAARVEGGLEECIAHLSRALEMEPRDPVLRERLGILLLEAGRPAVAVQHLRGAREIGGDRPYALNALAYYHYQRGEIQPAKDLFDLVLRLVPAPKPTREEKMPPVPPARAYALQGRQLVEDFQRLEVWTAAFDKPDEASLEGWRETERFGVEIALRGGAATLSGRQAGDPEGITSAMLERPVSARTFDRVALRARVDSGRVRLGLRLEARAARGESSAGLVFLRDLDGVLRVHTKTAGGSWLPVAPAEEGIPEKGQLVYPGSAQWPDDRGFHTMEIRRSRNVKPGVAGRPAAFDLTFDGEPVAWNVRAAGLTSDLYEVGFSGQTDAAGNEYSITVQSFKIYRERASREKTIQRR